MRNRWIGSLVAMVFVLAGPAVPVGGDRPNALPIVCDDTNGIGDFRAASTGRLCEAGQFPSALRATSVP